METWSTGMTKVGPMEVKKIRIFFSPKALISRVGPTGFLQSDDDAKLKIDEF